MLSRAEMDKYCKPGGHLGTHPDVGLPGIEASTGSLGHGLGIGMGMALADKVRGDDRVVYVVMSDGELQEGLGLGGDDARPDARTEQRGRASST